MKRLADQTFYEILEVLPEASTDEIQAAYEKARALYGPGSLVTYTLMEPDEAALLESRIEDARTTLLDPERRARYDELLQQPQEARAAAVAGAGIEPASASPPPDSPPPEPARESPPPPEPTVTPTPAILLGAALESAEPAAEEPPPTLPAPILLRHVVPPASVEADDLPTPAAPDAPTTPPAPAPRAVAPAPAPAPAPTPPPPLPDAWTGEALRQIRESRGLSQWS